jgi:hypothetical protein
MKDNLRCHSEAGEEAFNPFELFARLILLEYSNFNMYLQNNEQE